MRRIQGICELTLETDELDEMVDFYESIGLERLTTEETDRVWLATGERSRLGLWAPGEKEHNDRGGRHVHLAISVKQGVLERIGNKLSDYGVDVEGPIEHDGGDRSIYFDDPEGNRVELWDFFESPEGRREGVGALSESQPIPIAAGSAASSVRRWGKTSLALFATVRLGIRGPGCGIWGVYVAPGVGNNPFSA